MKIQIKIISINLLLLMIISCGNTTSEIAETVKFSLQERLNTDPDFMQYDLIVKSVNVMHVSENLYKDFADIEFKNRIHNIKIEILANGDDMMWEAPEGSFLFIEDEFRNTYDY